MIIRMIHLIVVCLFVAAAVHVYRIKFESTVQAERLARARLEVKRDGYGCPDWRRPGGARPLGRRYGHHEAGPNAGWRASAHRLQDADVARPGRSRPNPRVRGRAHDDVVVEHARQVDHADEQDRQDEHGEAELDESLTGPPPSCSRHGEGRAVATY